MKMTIEDVEILLKWFKAQNILLVDGDCIGEVKLPQIFNGFIEESLSLGINI